MIFSLNTNLSESNLPVHQLKKDLSQTCLEFSKNFNEEKGTVLFTLKELEGVPQDVTSGYNKVDGINGEPDKYAVTFKTPDIFPLVGI